MFPGRHVGSVPYAPSLPAGVTFLAPGHFLPSIQPMVLVHPRPDSETSPNARHHWAFFDGVHPMMYDVPIDLVGGAWPHVPVLMNAPPGMTILMPNYAAGPPYASPRLQWTPAASWSGTLWVRWYSQEYQTDQTQYIDQTFLLQTSGDISAGGVFILVNKDSGLAGNPGSWAQPVDDIPTVFGTTWQQAAPVIGGVSVAGKICVLMGSTAEYTWPLYTDGETVGLGFTVQVNTKPIALIGVPGQTLPKFSVAGAHNTALGTDTNASDWFMSRLNPDGYNTNAQNCQLTSVGGIGDNRITFDKITWTNSGWGGVTVVQASINAGVLNVVSVTSGPPILVGATIGLGGIPGTFNTTIASLGNGSGGIGTYNLANTTANFPTVQEVSIFWGRGNCVAFEAVHFNGHRKYIYVNDCTETNRQSGVPGNNGAGVDWFSCQYSLVQGWYYNDPTWHGDTATFLKIGNPNSEIRGGYILAGNVLRAFEFGYYSSGDGNFSLADIKHCVAVGLNYVGVPDNITPGYGLLRLGRCSLLSSSTNLAGIVRSANVGNGPYQITNLAVQGPITTMPSTPYVVESGNVVVTAGLLLADGSLDPSNPNYVTYKGTLGALVA